MCIGEYLSNITVDINNVTQDTFSVAKATSDNQLQLIFRKNIIVPIFGTFVVGVLLSNNGGQFLLKPTFRFSKNIQFFMVHIVSH